MDPDTRIDLETRLLFQEDTIARLNDALVEQQRQLDLMRETIKRLIELVERRSDDRSYSLEEERPPNY